MQKKKIPNFWNKVLKILYYPLVFVWKTVVIQEYENELLLRLLLCQNKHNTLNFFFWVELGSTFFLLKLKLMKIMLIKLSTKYMCFLGFETLFEFVNLTYFGNFLITIYFGNLRLNFDENWRWNIRPKWV